ncbi:Cl- channel voltage-gated family protein [Ancylobacter novellus DSM 506]|uniref:Cl-channel voltage-gated family protein n=1 Tax=Ancylobacter novellus (strain ATCC 8093 / DSM 506 / JCM 20403 / CCM 1077 / IAM 12100 / NBRC 12443 / NCIMB 10456) TaxID=639283 RepID=D7A5M2_ANCN5|nr:Cl- channel voltage-gated family protein [Ancylobacter novellus DSM 506]
MRDGASVTSDPTSGSETIPQRLRRLMRASELSVVALAAVVGVLAGLVVIAMNAGWQMLHELIFRIPAGAHLSVTTGIPPALVLLGPTLGGLLFGLASWWVLRGSAAPVDPIEANALHGGRMSLKDSFIVTVQTLFSSGVGASVGMEAGYTQAGSGLASFLGRIFRVRRADLRLLVSCGAGAAIGAAFNAPLMGAFYGFELILGTYAIPAFVPMMTASFTAALTRQVLAPEGHPPLPALDAPSLSDLPAVLLLGVACALVGIVVMRGATLVEAGFRRSALPAFLRPAVGGLIVGMLALWSPAVLSAGHGAVYYYVAADGTLALAGLLLVAKVAASSVSIGSGFRGGLFFASLLMGVLAGRVYAAGLEMLLPGMVFSHAFYALIGMSALAVAVVGGPMTMTLLALEMTGDLSLTLAVLAGAAAASLVTRRLFGFSFTTWRFHLRGENIRGAHDIGWLRELTVGSLMRREVPQLDIDTPLAEARRRYPPGSTSYLVATEHDLYAGMVSPAALYDAGEAEAPPPNLRGLLRLTQTSLHPEMTIREALDRFGNAEADALAVTTRQGQLVGVLSEAHAVKRYSDEMGRRLGELTGEKLD